MQVQVREDGKALWVNTDLGCVLRLCNIGEIVVNDSRSGADKAGYKVLDKPLTIDEMKVLRDQWSAQNPQQGCPWIEGVVRWILMKLGDSTSKVSLT